VASRLQNFTNIKTNSFPDLSLQKLRITYFENLSRFLPVNYNKLLYPIRNASCLKWLARLAEVDKNTEAKCNLKFSTKGKPYFSYIYIRGASVPYTEECLAGMRLAH
jgi:hypothetical protein